MASILDIIIKTIKQGTGIPETTQETTGLERALGGLNNALGVFGLALGGREVFELGKQLVNAARAANDAKGALTAAAGGIASYKDAMAAAQRVTEGMVSRTDLAASLTTIFGARLAGSAQEAADLASAGSILTSVFADAGASMELYTRLLSSGSIQLFNNFGISQQLVNEIKSQIEAEGKLHGEEARLAAVREALLQTAKKYRDSVSDDTKAARQFEAASQDLQAALGQVILPTATETMKNFGTVVRGAADATTDMPGPLQAAAQGFLDMVSPITTINSLIREYQELAGTASDASAELGQSASAAGDLASAAAGATGEFGPMTSSLDAMGFSAAGALEAVDPLTRGLIAQSRAAREAAAANKELAAAREQDRQAQSAAAAANNDLRARKEAAPELGARVTEARAAAFQEQEAKRQEQERADQIAQRQAQQTARAMGKAFDDVGQQISSSISGAVSGAIGELTEVWNPGGETDSANGAAQWARRMAAIAAGGIKDEWANPAQWANFGGDKSILQPLFDAISSGDDSAVKAQAQAILANKTADLFDANMIANQVEQKLRAQQIQQTLNDKVNALLGERGLQAVNTATQQVQQVATDTGIATEQVSTSAAAMGTNVQTAGAQMGESFKTAVTQLEEVNRLISEAIGLTRRWGEVTKSAVDSFNSIGPGAATQQNGNVPNAAQRKMGGPAAL